MDKRKLAKTLATKNPSTLRMVIGFDGFIDEINHVVDKRIDADHFSRIDTIIKLAARIERASGLSTNIELYPVQKKIGGNGPIMTQALAMHKADISYIGALGHPSVDDVFMPLADKVKLYSIAAPGHTDALEFDDGKVMLGKMSSLQDITYARLMEALGQDRLVALLSGADLIANVNWSMLPHMTSLWQQLIKDVLPLLPEKTQKPVFFVDLADPEKREHQEIKEALDLLKQFKSRFFVVLGLNKKEAYDIAGVLGLFNPKKLADMTISLEDVNQALYDHINIDAVVIHPVDRSSLVMHGTYTEAMGPYVSKPRLTTGAGDNFNAGFVLGLLLSLTPGEALLTGMATSGYYVRNAQSPTFEDLIGFISDWAENNI